MLVEGTPLFLTGEDRRHEEGRMRAEAGTVPRAKRRGERRLESSEISRVGEAKAWRFQGGKPPWSQDEVREGEAVSAANVGRGKALLSPSKKSLWEIVARPRVTRSEPRELRSRREERFGNGVKNPNGS
jgi:hypothetical protein